MIPGWPFDHLADSLAGIFAAASVLLQASAVAGAIQKMLFAVALQLVPSAAVAAAAVVVAAVAAVAAVVLKKAYGSSHFAAVVAVASRISHNELLGLQLVGEWEGSVERHSLNQEPPGWQQVVYYCLPRTQSGLGKVRELPKPWVFAAADV
jgi:hypothetical protein